MLKKFQICFWLGILSKSILVVDDVSHLVLQLPAVVGEGELLKGPFAVQEPVYGVLKRLGGSSLTICAWLPSSQFSGVSACLPAPGPDAFPLFPCCFQGPFARTPAVGTDPHLNLFARSPRREAGPADKGFSSTLSDGLNNYE